MIKFGPSGNDELFYAQGHKHSIEAFEWLNNLGLDLYEYSFGRGVLLKNDTAKLLGEKAKEFNIEISVHAPYFVNLATLNPEQQSKNEKYILDSLERLKLLGGKKCVLHSGTQTSFDRETAINLVKENILKVVDKATQNGFGDLLICPETMGKYTQIGNAEEIVDICSLHPMLVPTFDFGHLNCLVQGGLKTKDDFKILLELIKTKLGNKINDLHIHFSKIQYSDKGEVKHLTFDDCEFGPDFNPLLQALIEMQINPTIICESKDIMAQDALKMKKMYLSLAK